MTAAEAYAAVRDALLAVTVNQRAKTDRIVYHAGEPELKPQHDRVMTIVPIEHPRDFSRGGCNRKILKVDITVSYVVEPTGEFRTRYLLDSDEISDAVHTLPRVSGIKGVEEELTSIDEFDGVAEVTRIVAVTYHDDPL